MLVDHLDSLGRWRGPCLAGFVGIHPKLARIISLILLRVPLIVFTENRVGP